MPTLANALANVTTILENHSGVDYQCAPPWMHPKSPLHIDGVLGLLQQGLRQLQNTSGTLNKQLVEKVKTFITPKKGAQSPLRELVDTFMLNRPTKIMGHEDLQGFIQHIGTQPDIGSVVCNLILQRVPEAT